MMVGWKPPNWGTVKARVDDIDLLERGRRRGETDVVKATTATPGEYRATRPLEIVQIDHTKVDVFVVNDHTPEPIGRPWLTLTLDVVTLMARGFHFTMEAPSPLLTSASLRQS